MTLSTGTWYQLDVDGHPCDVYEPPTPNAAGFVVLYLHDRHGTQPRDQQSFVTEFCRHGLPVIAPHTGRSWWSDKIYPEFDPERTVVQYLFDSVLPYVEQRWQAVSPRIGLLGTEMGAQGALRLAYRHPDRFPVVAAISPAVDCQILFDDDHSLQQMYSDPEAVRQDTALLHIHPLNWPRNQYFCCHPEDPLWWDGVDRLRMKLASLGVPHECDLDSGADDPEFAYYNGMAERAISFLVERLDQERRRLV